MKHTFQLDSLGPDGFGEALKILELCEKEDAAAEDSTGFGEGGDTCWSSTRLILTLPLTLPLI